MKIVYQSVHGELGDSNNRVGPVEDARVRHAVDDWKRHQIRGPLASESLYIRIPKPIVIPHHCPDSRAEQDKTDAIGKLTFPNHKRDGARRWPAGVERPERDLV